MSWSPKLTCLRQHPRSAMAVIVVEQRDMTFRVVVG